MGEGLGDGMTQLIALELAKRLIAHRSITPATGSVFDEMESMLEPLGFEVARFTAGEAPDGPVENLFAIRKSEKNSKPFRLCRSS